MSDQKTDQRAVVVTEAKERECVIYKCTECGGERRYDDPETVCFLGGRGVILDVCTPCRPVQLRKEWERRRQGLLDWLPSNIPCMLARYGVPSKWQGASFDKCSDLPGGLVNSLKKWAEEPKGILYLHGHVGSGKTWGSVAILAHMLATGVNLDCYLEDHSEKSASSFRLDYCRYVAEREYLERLKADFREKGVPIEQLRSYRLRKVWLLVYDDLGTQYGTDWARTEIGRLIEDRHSNELPTVITSNLSLNELAKLVDARLASRIAESHNVLEFPKRDLRLDGTLTKDALRTEAVGTKS